MREYRKRHFSLITAVKLDLETTGFTYKKWGGVQTCKPGDWIVDNEGDAYTIDSDVFASTYSPADTPGRYQKNSSVWAKTAKEDGSIRTKEGVTHYKAGDYIVYNDREQRDGYAVAAEKFEEMYALKTD